jgi:hypothetical protein
MSARSLSAPPCGLILLLAFVLPGLSFAQSEKPDLYAKAMSESRTNARVLAMQDFLSSGNTGSRKADALEVMVWDYKQLGNHQKAAEWAQKLLDADSGNPLALAVLADSARYHTGTSLDQNMALSLELASRGMKQENTIRPPEGMLATEFVRMQNAVTAWLNGSAGFAYMHQLDYPAARGYLRKATKFEPDNPQYVYELALADLMGKQQEPKEGFLYLAKAVNLTQGTPAGQQIAAFAAARYAQAGGTPQNWNQYLVATAPAGRAPATVAAAASPTTPNTTIAANQAARPAQLPQSSSPRPAVNSKTEASERVNKHISEQQIAAALTPPPLPPTQTAPKPLSHPGAPVSIGILLQAAINNKENRRAVAFALSDLVRHLRENDEAFILSFSNDLVFEQDLTSNYDLLRDAVDAVKPATGAALLDAVGFASGHLNRIARKNNNRVLLVISDGREANSKSSPYEVTGAIDASGVRIDCIGYGIGESESRGRLQALASRTGGQAAFVFDSGAFRSAARDMARNLGIDFPQ